MSSTKFFELLESLNPNEFKQLGDFVRSPAFNKSERITKLYDIVKKNGNNYVNKLQIHESLYPNNTYDDDKTRLVISDFVKLIEIFLVVKGLEKDQLSREVLLAKELLNRNAGKCFNSILIKLKNRLENNSTKDGEDYLHLTNLQIYETIMLSCNRLKIPETSKLYRMTIESIEKHFMFSVLMIRNCFIQSLMQKPHDNYHFWLNNEITEHIEKNIADYRNKDKLIYIHYLIYMLYTKDKQGSFLSEISGFLRENHSELPIEGLIYIYNTIDHYFIYLHERTIESMNQRFDMTKAFDSIGYFRRQRILDGSVFFNVINTCLEAGQREFAEIFYKEYFPKISEKIREDVKELSFALMLMHAKDFEGCLLHLNNVKLQNYQFYLKTRVFQIMAYYELKEFNLIYENIDAFRHYIKRHYSLLGSNSFRYTNFCHYVTRISKMSENSETVDLFVKSKVEKDSMVSKEWILEKFEELENRQNKSKRKAV